MEVAQTHRPRRADGTVVDATFELAATTLFELVYHHKAGGRGSPRAMNSDYHEGLELLLKRLGEVGCTILGISVDSSVARQVPSEERELNLDYPIRVTNSTDPRRLRLRITRAQRPIARRPDARPSGGNDQKRIRFNFALDRSVTLDELNQFLVG